MLTEATVALFLLTSLLCFFAVNLHNILRMHKRTERVKVYAEVERPTSFTVGLAAIGTFVYFLEVLFYLFLVFTGLNTLSRKFALHFQLPFTFCLQLFGLVLTSLGYFIFIWSVIARGRYAVSWDMPENQKLVTWGPYRYVRHPSYLGYFLMFTGLFFLWTSILTIFPLVAIPGYFQITFEEEKLLIQRFGNKYIEYQKKTGRFIPKLH